MVLSLAGHTARTSADKSLVQLRGAQLRWLVTQSHMQPGQAMATARVCQTEDAAPGDARAAELACVRVPRAGEAAGHGQDECHTDYAEYDIRHDAREGTNGFVRRHVVHGLRKGGDDRIACSTVVSNRLPTPEPESYKSSSERHICVSKRIGTEINSRCTCEAM